MWVKVFGVWLLWRHLGLLSQVRADVYEKVDKELLEFVEDVLLNRCENATERMLEYAATLDPKSTPTNVRKKGQVCARPYGRPFPHQGASSHASWLQQVGRRGNRRGGGWGGVSRRLPATQIDEATVRDARGAWVIGARGKGINSESLESTDFRR